jgi:hypothetical protein
MSIMYLKNAKVLEALIPMDAWCRSVQKKVSWRSSGGTAFCSFLSEKSTKESYASIDNDALKISST